MGLDSTSGGPGPCFLLQSCWGEVMERIKVGAHLTAAPFLSEALVELAPGSSSLTICCPCCRPDPHKLCWESQDGHLLRAHSCPQLA